MDVKLAIAAATSLWLLLISPSVSGRPAARIAHETFHGGNIDLSSLGAQPGGDITQAFRKAWNEACRATSPSKIIVPKGNYRLWEIELEGPCKAPIIIQNCGTLEAPSNPAEMKADAWIKIRYVDFLTVDGGGTFDGKGKIAWTQNDCAKNSNCKRPPMNFRFDFVKNSLVTGVTSQDSKNFHVNVLGCKNLTFDNFSIKTADNSLNTDGIHIGRSDGVKILHSKIETGDDCVSLGDGSRDVTIEGVKCGPGHGISIGSLGRYKEEEAVRGIVVKDCTLTNTQNGLRIKSWPDLEENTVDGVHFEGITMDNVSNPIILDQEYCPWHQCRAGKPSKVQVKNVSFKNIKGTSATAEAVKILCSPGKCHNLELANIDLKYTGSQKADGCASFCKNVKPTIVGTLNPKSTTC